MCNLLVQLVLLCDPARGRFARVPSDGLAPRGGALRDRPGGRGPRRVAPRTARGESPDRALPAKRGDGPDTPSAGRAGCATVMPTRALSAPDLERDRRRSGRRLRHRRAGHLRPAWRSKGRLLGRPGFHDLGSLTPDDLAYFETTFCGAAGAGAEGGFGRVKALLGDVWGTVDPGLASTVISRLSPPSRTSTWSSWRFRGPWGGRTGRDISGAATTSCTTYATQYAWSTRRWPSSSTRRRCTCKTQPRHGLGACCTGTHMVNFYQRSVTRGTPNDTWLEETTATMTDDIVTPVATPNHVAIVPGQRDPPLRRLGRRDHAHRLGVPGAEQLRAGRRVRRVHRRRYGTSILSGTVDCPGTGVDWSRTAHPGRGRHGFTNDFARVGASISGSSPRPACPRATGTRRRSRGATRSPPSTSRPTRRAGQRRPPLPAWTSRRGARLRLRRRRRRPDRLHAHGGDSSPPAPRSCW